MNQMRKIKNPFIDVEGYHCFGCSPDNENGLMMEFYEDGDYLVSEWQPKTFLHGYGNVLHGGIQSTLLDEIASWVVYVKAKTAGVTANMEVKFKKTVYVDKGNLTVRAKLEKVDKKFAYIVAELLDHDGNSCAEGKLRYFLFPEPIARKKLHYPGSDAFYE
jgi:uncharacterized protein (TIGR00369 family)